MRLRAVIKLAITVLAAVTIYPQLCLGQVCPSSSELPLEVARGCPSLPPKGCQPAANVTVYIVSTPQYPFSPARRPCSSVDRAAVS